MKNLFWFQEQQEIKLNTSDYHRQDSFDQKRSVLNSVIFKNKFFTLRASLDRPFAVL